MAKIPDSLKNSFKTINQRIVTDGGGVEPDVVTESPKFQNIVNSLLSKGLIFDYATEYFLKHPEISVAADFKLSEQDFNDFLLFLKNKEYDYVTKTEDALKSFEKMAEKESYYASLKPNIEELRQKINQDKEQDVIKHKAIITSYLTEEIVSRYYYQKGRIENSLNNDPDVVKAIELFSDIENYTKILNPSK